MNDFFKIDLSQLSILNYVWVLFVGILLWVFIQFVKRYLIYAIVKSPIRQKRIINSIPIYASLFWLLYGVYVMYLFIKPYPLMGVLVFLVSIIIARKPINNLIQGLFIRFKANIEQGQRVRIGNYEGTIMETNSFDLVLEASSGELIHIPYSTLENEKIIFKDFSSDFFSDSFKINTIQHISIEQIEEYIANLPWTFSNYPPKISIIEEDSNSITFEIIVYSIDRRYLSFIKKDVRVFCNAI